MPQRKSSRCSTFARTTRSWRSGSGPVSPEWVEALTKTLSRWPREPPRNIWTNATRRKPRKPARCLAPAGHYTLTGPLNLARGSATRRFPTLHLQPVNLGRELVEALPRRCEGERHRFEPLGRTARGRGCRCQPSKAWRPSGDRFSDPAAIGLPSYAGSKTKEKNHQNADERQ